MREQWEPGSRSNFLGMLLSFLSYRFTGDGQAAIEAFGGCRQWVWVTGSSHTPKPRQTKRPLRGGRREEDKPRPKTSFQFGESGREGALPPPPSPQKNIKLVWGLGEGGRERVGDERRNGKKRRVQKYRNLWVSLEGSEPEKVGSRDSSAEEIPRRMSNWRHGRWKKKECWTSQRKRWR